MLYMRACVQYVECELYTGCTAVACEDLFILGQNITLHCHSTTITTTTSHQHQDDHHHLGQSVKMIVRLITTI